jgi:predicted glycogen debranching enzyme
MTHIDAKQFPEPGRHLLKTRGDTIELTLELAETPAGTAWVRTNLGHARTVRKEIIRWVIHDEPLLGREWYDIQMIRLDEKRFHIRLGLTEVGHFEAKCYFLFEGDRIPAWPPGANLSVNVLPTDTCCANTVYNAFVRQFGPNKDGSFCLPEEKREAIKALDRTGYTVIPPSGTFRDLIRELDFIIDHLGCRFIQLLPINPTPTTYGRMGRFGSPYASLDFTSIDPALAEFDTSKTPLEQFIELVDAVHAKGAKLIMDIAPNHTGWAAELHETHPEWLVRDDSGRIEAPGAWGITWADLARLDYGYKDLWEYMGEVFLIWCRRGIDGFRCDAGYMIPVAAWLYIISVVREEFPETVFFLEGLGGKISVTRHLLNKAGFDWAYSELFQNYDRRQIEHYLPGSLDISRQEGLMIHYAETHDNDRLAATSHRYAAMRTALCALTSPHGGFGFANGVEWFADEKIDVHNARSLNWGNPANQVERIRRINILLKTHPAFFDQADIRMIQAGDANALAVLRHHAPTGTRLLVTVNLDCENVRHALWSPDDAGMSESIYRDLMTDQAVTVEQRDGGLYGLELAPGQVCCLSAQKEFHEISESPEIPERIGSQRLSAAALEVFRAFYGVCHLGGLDLEEAKESFSRDPEDFCRQMNPEGEEARVIPWQWPEDRRRQVMVPPGHFLLIKAPSPFRARLVESGARHGTTVWVAESLAKQNGTYFALIPPLENRKEHTPRSISLSVFEEGGPTHAQGPVLYLAEAEEVRALREYDRRRLTDGTLRFLGTNGRGAMMRAHAAWSGIDSKYDGLLAANINPDYPDDRRMMLVRFRAWLVFQGYSQDIAIDCQQLFRIEAQSRCSWHFTIPCGQGQHVVISFCAEMIRGENRVHLDIERPPAEDRPERLPDDRTVTLIFRPDIDDRNFHENTKAYLGPEKDWPKRFETFKHGFSFTPHAERRLDVRSRPGRFVWEPEWHYMQYLPTEDERGLEPHTDLFSPGYFSLDLSGGDKGRIKAAVNPETAKPEEISRQEPADPDSRGQAPAETGFEEQLREALNAYIVRRKRLHTVIAGYPWFLDWGRDTLIVTRGLVSAGYLAESETILMQFAGFEEGGTLPNMIRGNDAGNRDTSDAPLWFFVAVNDLLNAKGDVSFLERSVGRRSILDILKSIAKNYMQGTPNGIRMDRESGLVFSPSHFTWMDTNHPAGSPREGFPIEIQALWHFALRFLARVDGSSAHWKESAETVHRSIKTRYALSGRGFLSDCLHAGPGASAADAVADDALRPNQLFAATLGAVDNIEQRRTMLFSCMPLLVPGAIRSLADRPVEYPLPVRRDGQLLNDPHRPYQGLYTGDEDTSRKPAYHNGTAWTWVFPSFCEGWAAAYGDQGKKTARAWLSSASLLLNAGCAGQIPEVLDGDAPHVQKGCDAQAWGVSEVLRVWKALEPNEKTV